MYKNNDQIRFQWHRMLQLFFQPRDFFSSKTYLHSKYYHLVIGWIIGMSWVIKKTDAKLTQAQYGQRESLMKFLETITVPWWHYWLYITLWGMFSGWIIWLVYGWWYHQRLKWSGLEDDQKRLSRLVYISASFVAAVPTLVVAMMDTFVYENYMISMSSTRSWPLLLVIFPFWSCVVSYIGATTTFQIRKKSAIFWFLILPMLVYGFSLAGLVIAVAKL